MLRIFLLLVSLVSDNGSFGDIAHRAYIVGAMNVCVLSLVVVRFAVRQRLANRK